MHLTGARTSRMEWRKSDLKYHNRLNVIRLVYGYGATQHARDCLARVWPPVIFSFIENLEMAAIQSAQNEFRFLFIFQALIG